MEAVIVFDNVRLAIEKRIEETIKKYPQLEENRDFMFADLLRCYNVTGEIADITPNR